MDLFSRPNGAFIKSKQNTYHHLRGIWEGFLGKALRCFRCFFLFCVVFGGWNLDTWRIAVDVLPRWFPWRGIASKLICWGISAFGCFGWVDGHGWLVIWRNQLVNDSWDLEHFCLGKIFGIYYMKQFDIANNWERIPWILIVLKNHSNSFGMTNSPLAVWNWCVLKWLGGCCKWSLLKNAMQ